MIGPIVFFGSGPVAATSLELLAQDFMIEAVITKPKPEHHKGAFPVLQVAEKLDLKVLTVTNKQSLNELIASSPVSSPVGILIDFGIIISRQVIDYFDYGIVNSHFSILPEWRGADPITFSILSGQKKTGVSIMRLTEGLDEGPLLRYGEMDLPESITTPELTEKLIDLSNSLLVQEMPRLLSGESTGVPQGTTGRQVSYSRKLTKEDGVLDLKKPAVQLEREVRAFIEWPKSRLSVHGIDVIVTAAHVETSSDTHSAHEAAPASDKSRQLAFQTGEGILVVDKLKPAGKNEMTAAAFMAGYVRGK
jgi:methionyl-tRNA formyltransferase